MEDKQKFRLKTLFFMVNSILRAAPILFPLLIVLTTFSIGLSAYALFVLRDATNAIVDLLNLNTTLSNALFLVWLYLCIEVVFSQIIQYFIDYVEKFYYKQADKYFRTLLLYKLGKLPQVNMYDHEVYNKFQFTFSHLHMFQQLPWHLVSFLINFSFSKLLYLGIIFAFNPLIGLYCTILFGLNILVSIFITSKQAIVDKEQVTPIRTKDYFNSLLSTKGSIKETKINLLEDYFFDRFKELYLSIRDAYYRIERNDHIISQLIHFSNFIFNNGLVIALLYLIYKDQLNIGEMALILSAGTTLIHSASQFKYPTKYLVQFVKYAPTMIEMLFPITKEERKDMKEKDYPNFELTLGEFERIKLDNVSFNYPAKEECSVEGINLTINRGEIISILGYNGSGKTTTCKLISGVLTPTKGTIYFNDRDVLTIDQSEYYKYFGIGFQDYAKFNLSLKDNIVFGRIEEVNNDPMLESAIEKTNLENIIHKLPHGVDTYLGKEYDEKGQDLSGGQWQRVILARAYMGSPEILILDEPTASIDPFEEERMLEEFRQALENKTAILISHRISFARLADRIVMMKDGKIIEIGNHDELVKNKGYYYELFSSQKELYQSEVKVNES